jgi:uncharacterized protein (TIGR02265 family)
MNDSMVFSQAVEGLLRALGPRLDDAAKDKLKALGLDVRIRLEPAYSLAVWTEVMRYGSTLVAPGRPPGEQMFELGRRFIEGYSETIVGKAMLTALKVLGPRRTLERMNRNFRSGNNYTETKLEPKGPTDFTLWFSQVKEPEFYRGMLEAGVTRAGARNIEVKTIAHDSSGATFSIRWT